MGHRRLYNTSPMFEDEPDQNWNHMHNDQRYLHLDSISFPAQWNSVTRPNGHASSSLNIEAPPHQSDASGTSHDHLLNSSSAGTFFAGSENYAYQSSSSNYDRHTYPVVDGSFMDHTMGNGRGPHKRKSPGMPPICERGSTSRYFNSGSSADLPMSPELRQEKPNIDSHYMPWDHASMTPIFRGSGLSIRDEGSSRNVRSRIAHDLESNMARTHLSSNTYSTGTPVDHSGTTDHSSQTSSTLMRDWSQMNMCPAHGRVLLSDASAFNHETSHLLGSGSTNAPVDDGVFHHEFGTIRNPTAPPSFHNTLPQTARGVRTNYSQRAVPSFRASSSLAHVAPSDDGLHMVTESYSSRNSRPLTTIGWRNNDRNERSRISSDRYRSLVEEVGLPDRFSSEGFVIVDRASMYGSRNILDQHRDMRMDIDNMSYEDLLALGERIGHVSTGVSEDSISKCLTETIYCSSDQSQEEGSCPICLEEYKNMDDVGSLKTCGHDYHVSCIRKWLSMKNICPICKASALPESKKDK